MFISYNMFIFLIILTIIMIALIIYLTITAKGPKKQKKITSTPIVTQDTQQPIEHSRIPTSSYENSNNNYSNEHSDHYPFDQNQTSSTTQSEPYHSDLSPTSEQSLFEEELYVLPYPKEETNEDETIYTTSIFRRSSQNKNELTSNSENQHSTKQE